MAPERPRSLVILDLSEPEAQDGGTVYHWDPVNPDRELVVLWEAARCPGGFVDTAATVSFRSSATQRVDSAAIRICGRLRRRVDRQSAHRSGSGKDTVKGIVYIDFSLKTLPPYA